MTQAHNKYSIQDEDDSFVKAGTADLTTSTAIGESFM